MEASAEIRWFWKEKPPAQFKWFFESEKRHGCAVGGGEKSREDFYLRDCGQVELGVKRRGGKAGVEIKGLVAVVEKELACGPFVGPIEIWCKWPSESLPLDLGLTVAVEKRRWMRKFATAPLGEIPLDGKEQPLDGQEGEDRLPERGCNVELTEVKLPCGEMWWTLGFEAFGALATVENDLRAIAAQMAERNPPPLGDGVLASYPAWLNEYVYYTQRETQ